MLPREEKEKQKQVKENIPNFASFDSENLFNIR